jgi:hypothetical protein
MWLSAYVRRLSRVMRSITAVMAWPTMGSRIVHEGREAWAGKGCADCAPIDLKSHIACDEEGCC